MLFVYFSLPSIVPFYEIFLIAKKWKKKSFSIKKLTPPPDTSIDFRRPVTVALFTNNFIASPIVEFGLGNINDDDNADV